jgi:hypothetical protein
MQKESNESHFNKYVKLCRVVTFPGSNGVRFREVRHNLVSRALSPSNVRRAGEAALTVIFEEKRALRTKLCSTVIGIAFVVVYRTLTINSPHLRPHSKWSPNIRRNIRISRKFNNFQIFWKLSQEHSVPFATVSKVREVYFISIKWKAIRSTAFSKRFLTECFLNFNNVATTCTL